MCTYDSTSCLLHNLQLKPPKGTLHHYPVLINPLHLLIRHMPLNQCNMNITPNHRHILLFRHKFPQVELHMDIVNKLQVLLVTEVSLHTAIHTPHIPTITQKVSTRSTQLHPYQRQLVVLDP